MAMWTGSPHSLPADKHRNIRVSRRDSRAKTATTIILIDSRCTAGGAAIAAHAMTRPAGGQTNRRITTSNPFPDRPLYAPPADGASAGSSAGINRVRSRRAGTAR